MKSIFTATGIALFTLLCASCKKENSTQVPIPAPAEMVRIDMGETGLVFGNGPFLFDFDNDGTRDFLFKVNLVGDPLAGVDKRRFMVSSGIRSLFAVNSNEETPCLNKGDSVRLTAFNGYNWNLVSSVLLIERVENMVGNISWNGNWKNAVKKYLPFQMLINDQPHAGWIELSIDIPHQKIILHRGAYSKLANRTIAAGD